MNRSYLVAGGVALAALLVLVLSSLFTVHQSQQALITQFGDPRRVVQDPGLHMKVPFIQTAVYMERRVLDFDVPSQEVILGDRKRLVVDLFARYRINDPLRFYQSVGGLEAVLRARLESIMDASMRKVLGNVPLFTVLSEDRAALMNDIKVQANVETKQFGIDVIDVRIRRADLPEENNQAIYRRMQTEREREAKELRAQGAELAQRIRSRAERERRVIIAEAEKESQILRGEGDGQAVKIFAEAYGQDVNFFSFYRSMQAYRSALTDESTNFVLSPEAEFFDYFKRPSAEVAQPAVIEDGEGLLEEPETAPAEEGGDAAQAPIDGGAARTALTSPVFDGATDGAN
ncbi:MAG: protease modulator HflC [Geminicoccaceae bacterium]